jgi:hypothetical protein
VARGFERVAAGFVTRPVDGNLPKKGDVPSMSDRVFSRDARPR